MANSFVNILSISVLLVVSALAHGVTVHTWKDAAGVTHFSDEPGPQGIRSDKLELEELSKPAGDADDDFYSIANQWKRLKAERDLAKTQRLEKQRLRAQERSQLAALEFQAAEAEANRSPQTYPIFGAGIRPGFGNGFHRPGFGLPPYSGRPGDYARPNQKRQARHPNYHSPFHDRAQPQSIRSKPLRRNSSNNADYHSGGYGQRGRSVNGGSLFVRF